MESFDLLVIGSGPGGQRAAIQAAKLGKRAAVIERREIVGGVTAHTGTIPSKSLREAVLYLCGWREKGIYGRSHRVKSDITAQDLFQRLGITVQHEIEIIEHQLQRNGVRVIHGMAKFLDPHTVHVTSITGQSADYRADKIVIATGTVPHRPDNIPFDDETIIDSDGLLQIKAIPRSMTVIGAGVIGVEYATIFSALDAKITLVDNRNTILDFVDSDIVDEFRHDLLSRGIQMRLGEDIERVEKAGDGSVLTWLKSGKKIRSDLLMVAAGRTGATGGLDLDKAGVPVDARGRLTVQPSYQTEVPHIYAVGDVIGFPALASTSAEQGRLAACHAFGGSSETATDYFPVGIYAVPEISIVGKTEQQLRKEGIAYETGVARLRETARGQIQGVQDGLLKLLFGLKDHRLLGAHIVGEGATELIHIGQAVIAHNGTLEYFVGAVFNYPTFAEAYKIAALDAWNRVRV
ncbi:MAG: Si-specific NAD(P)(+) transhydrogenase [Gammaproteobacteria bacterium]|nr:Si-specific NAD(P)(+) transhydrogenase [Gammaproteobacteria bacterium]